MANVIGEHTIRANIRTNGVPIVANVIENEQIIKANITQIPSATTERKGIIRIATLEETMQGIDNTLAVTPYSLKNANVSDKTFVFEQGIATDVWQIKHDLNKFPSVTLVDSAGTQFQGRVEYIDENNCIVYMNGATKGKAYLN